MNASTQRTGFYYIAASIVAIWLVYFVDAVVPYDLSAWGVQPRQWSGIAGIVLMPILHADFLHLFGNTISLSVLLSLLVASQDRPWPIIAALSIGSGSLLWLIGREGNHIGASSLVFALISYLIAGGILERKPLPIVIALVVGFLFGGHVAMGHPAGNGRAAVLVPGRAICVARLPGQQSLMG